MPTELINLKLRVQEWPLKNVGDEMFFGYVVAMGVFPRDWGSPDGLTQYVDFAYSDDYNRYRLPHDEGLRRQLHDLLWDNINGIAHSSDIYGKVWIELGENGYSVSLP